MLKLRLFAVLLLVAGFAGAAFAQTGSIQGTVADNSGAVVQGADVIVRNMETNAQRAVSSSATGVYSVPNLPVGHYEITAKKESFKAYHLNSIELTVANVLGVDITLEPGTVSEEVMVRASDVPNVDLETSQVSNIVDSKRILGLPLLTRDPYELILLSPGTVPVRQRAGRIFGEWIAGTQQQFPARWFGQQRHLGPRGCKRSSFVESGRDRGVSRHHQQLHAGVRAQQRRHH